MSDQLPSILDINTTEVPELSLASEGEKLLKIKKLDLEYRKDQDTGVRSEANGLQIHAVLSMLQEPNTYDIHKYMTLPRPSDEDDYRDVQLRGIKAFLQCFRIPEADQGDLNQYIGREGWGTVVVEKSKDPNYPDKNIVRRFTKPA